VSIYYIVIRRRLGNGSESHLSGPFSERERAEAGATNALGVPDCLSVRILTGEQVREMADSGGCAYELREQAVAATRANPPDLRTSLRYAASKGDEVAKAALHDLELDE
jgi:hypothetical protein